MFVCYLSYLSGVCKCSSPISYQAVVFYKETAFLLWRKRRITFRVTSITESKWIFLVVQVEASFRDIQTREMPSDVAKRAKN